MTTARERAREAALTQYSHDFPVGREQTIKSADAASDVWEPLLREAFEAFSDWEAYPPTFTEMDKRDSTLKKIREALGENDDLAT